MDNPDNIFWTIDIILFIAIVVGIGCMFKGAKSKDGQTAEAVAEDVQEQQNRPE